MSVHLTSVKSTETSMTYHTQLKPTYILPYPVLCIKLEWSMYA